MIRRIGYGIFLFAAASALRASTASSFTGTFIGRNDIALFAFTLASDSNVTLRTFSYAGGQDAAGDLIPHGGFDPAVAIFQLEAPQLLLSLDDAEHCGGSFISADPSTGLCLDSEMVDVPLTAGQYVVTLTQSDRLPVGPTYPDGFTPATEFGPGEFVDFTGADRTGNWELDIVGASNATEVPEPGAAALLIVGIIAVAWRMSAIGLRPVERAKRARSARDIPARRRTHDTGFDPGRILPQNCALIPAWRISPWLA